MNYHGLHELSHKFMVTNVNYLLCAYRPDAETIVAELTRNAASGKIITLCLARIII